MLILPSRIVPSLLLTCTLLACAGCSREPTPEQRRADARRDEARLLFSQGNSLGARQALFEALDLDRQIGRKERVAEETRMLAELSIATASFDSAFDWYGQSLEASKEISDRASARGVTLAVAALYRQMGSERKAWTMYTEALRLARVFHDEDGVRSIEWAMLPCARAIDADEDEAQVLRELMQTYVAAGDVAHQGAVLLESGMGKYDVQVYDRAAEDFLNALMLANQSQDSLLAISASLHLAMAFEGAGRMQDALSNYAECLRRADRTKGASVLRLEALIRVGNLYLERRQFPDALRFYHAAYASAYAFGNMIAEGYLLVQMGHCQQESSREQAEKNYRAGRDVFERLSYAAGEAYALLSLGHFYERTNQPNDALDYYKKAVDQSEAATATRGAGDLTLDCEQAFFGTRRTPWYDDAIDILLQLGRYDEALQYADRRDSRDMFDALSGMNVVLPAEAGGTLLETCTAERGRFIGAQRELVALAAVKNEHRDLLDSVRAAVDRYHNRWHAATAAAAQSRKAIEPFVQVSSVTVAGIQKALPPGTAFVRHLLARRALYAFVVTGGKSVVQVAAFEKDRVFDLSREFSELLRKREELADSSAAQLAPIDQRLRELNGPLAEAFIRPLEGAVAGVQNLIVVLPRELPWFPMHVLLRGPLRPGGYVAEQHTISYLPSAGTLLLPRQEQGPVRDVMGLGYPGTTGWDVEYELRDIHAFYKQARLYFDQQASFATLLKDHADVLHLAVPFQFHEGRPENSSFALSDGQSSEVLRHIPLGDILTLPPSSTVVVSDLDAGRFGIHPIEPYVFLADGVQEVVFTSHPPTRKAKKIFGELFYTSLLEGSTPRVAYHNAQVGMIKSEDFSHPSMWGWFTLWGI